MKDGWDSLIIDVYTAWPEKREHIVAESPDNRGFSGTYSAGRTKGKEASFVTVIELQEDKAK